MLLFFPPTISGNQCEVFRFFGTRTATKNRVWKLSTGAWKQSIQEWFWLVGAAAAAWFLAAATSACLRGRLLRTSATLQAVLPNTEMLLLFENVQTEEGKGKPKAHECAHFAKFLLVLVLAGPLIHRFCVNMFLVQRSRWFPEMLPGLERTRRYPESGCSFVGKKADLSMLVAPGRVLKTSPCPSAHKP